MAENITAFDAIVIGILLLSGLLALVRGFIRESLSVAAFVAAAFGALWMLPVLREPARNVIQPGIVADIAVLAGTFLLVYLAVTLVTSSLSKNLRGGDEPGMLDRTAGLLFGLGRGLVIVALFFIGYTAFFTPNGRPGPWATDARLYPLITSTAVALQDLAPESSRIGETNLTPAASSETPARQERAAPATVEEAPAEGPAYEDETRRSLDQLIGARADEDENGEP